MPNRIEHIGLVIDDLSAGKDFMVNVLGFELEREVDLPERAVQAAFYRSGSIQLEIIELTTDEARRRRLGPEGTKGRIEHIAIIVDDLAATLEKVRAHGVRWTPPEPPYTRIPGRTWVFTDPDTTGGIMYQFMELDT
jgi:methylmalonyl-CoA/ethylmalonyl-CoA epimerase